MASIFTVLLTIFAIALLADGEEFIEAFGKKLVIPNACLEDNHLCTVMPENYPKESVDSLVAEKLANISNPNDIIIKAETSYRKNAGCRREAHRNCCSESKYERPYFVRSEEKHKLVIQSEFFDQVIKVTKCANEGFTCFEGLGLWQTAKCVTKYGATKILVFNTETKKLETVSATFPVYCSCAIFI